MKSKQILFFALLRDIEGIIKNIEETFPIKYYKMGLFDNKTHTHYKSIFELKNLGYTKFGDWNYSDAYLVMPDNISIDIREVQQRKGGIRYAIDQMENSESIEFKLGGIFIEREKILVAGRLATISNSAFSNEIFKLFSSMIRKEFKKIGEFYVGKKATEKLFDGWRLVTNEKMSKGYDLQPPSSSFIA